MKEKVTILPDSIQQQGPGPMVVHLHRVPATLKQAVTCLLSSKLQGLALCLDCVTLSLAYAWVKIQSTFYIENVIFIPDLFKC